MKIRCVVTAELNLGQLPNYKIYCIMLGTGSLSRSSKRPARPYSAMSSYSHQTSYRLTDNESLNKVKSTIHETFGGENRSLKEVRELTSKSGQQYAKRIDRLCSQFNIGPSPLKHRHFSSEVDVDFIAKHFISSKSKEKKKEEEKDLMRK